MGVASTYVHKYVSSYVCVTVNSCMSGIGFPQNITIMF